MTENQQETSLTALYFLSISVFGVLISVLRWLDEGIYPSLREVGNALVLAIILYATLSLFVISCFLTSKALLFMFSFIPKTIIKKIDYIFFEIILTSVGLILYFVIQGVVITTLLMLGYLGGIHLATGGFFGAIIGGALFCLTIRENELLLFDLAIQIDEWIDKRQK